MSERNQDLSRRKSTANTSFPPNPANSVQEEKAAIKKDINSGKIYYINRECIGCQVCLTFCPAQAIRFGYCGNEIVQSKCTHCGICYEECPISAISETEIGASYYEEKKTSTTKVMDCDLVILGAGGAGLVAAVKAHDLTGKKVIILEKAKKPGGATRFATGLAIVKDSQWQKNAGYEVNEPRDITGRFFDWLVSKGGAEEFFRVARPEENRYRTIYTLPRTEKYKDLPDPSIGPGTGGTFIVDKMVECCQKQGIKVLTETPARKFITDKAGKVTGVLADTKDGQLLVNCKACVIASGGFGRNLEMLRKYWPEPYNNEEMHFLCPPGMMGDGINMAEEIGAYIDQTKWSMATAGGFFTDDTSHHPYSWAVMSIMRNGMFVSINLDGKRWRNESGFGVSPSTQPGSVAYSVADAEIVETVGSQMVSNWERMGKGMGGGTGGDEIMMGMMIDKSRDPNSVESRAIKRWREDLEYEAAIDDEGASGNHAKKADTLEELALKMKIDPRTFVETIERYNKFCETGKDLEFGKSPQMLKAIKKPPFWAIYGHRWSQCTKGLHGIAVNPKLEVLNPKGEAIPGLYAAGDTCTIYGGLVIDGPSARHLTATGTQGGAPSMEDPGEAFGGAPSMGGPGPGAAPATSTNILSTEPCPCGGSSAALISGYYAGMYVADYLNKETRRMS